MGSERESVEGCGDYEECDDPPRVAHAGRFDGKVGVRFGGDAGVEGEFVVLAVFMLCSFVVVVH